MTPEQWGPEAREKLRRAQDKIATALDDLYGARRALGHANRPGLVIWAVALIEDLKSMSDRIGKIEYLVAENERRQVQP